MFSKQPIIQFYAVANYPVLSGDWLRLQVKSEQDLRRENIALKAELLQAQVRLQKLSELSAENTRLRGLVNTPLIIDGRVLIAEIIGVDSNPLNHVVIINKGRHEQLQEGRLFLMIKGLWGRLSMSILIVHGLSCYQIEKVRLSV